MTTPAKLVTSNNTAIDMKKYEDMDVDQLLAQLSPEEIQMLAKEVDPDDNLLPPSQRCSYECAKEPTGPLNRKKLIEHINKQALETPDKPENKPYVAGTVRGKKWIPPQNSNQKNDNEKIKIDLDDEYDVALNSASQEEIIDLAAILGFHSMMNQEQYHASLTNKGQPVGLGWDGITKATQPKAFPPEPPNNTDPDDSIRRVRDDDHTLIDLNWNNIKNISDEKFEQLFAALPDNQHLETLSLSNTGLTDRVAVKLADAIEKNNTLKVVNVETNFISPIVIVRMVRSLLKQRVIEEFRASNQRSQVLGNKIEMEITKLIEANPTILRLGLHLEYNDARHRISAHLQRNLDRTSSTRIGEMNRFPDALILGASTSAFQIEGAWNVDGKGENIWDRLIHSQPALVRDGTNADTACKSYYKYEQDVGIVKEIGFSAYKFSISWSRVLPDGVITNINQAGINYYSNLIDELGRNNIQPMACLYHFDLPQKLQDIGGWCNPLMVDYFADYARLMYQSFGNRVKWWTTINEPTEIVHGLVDRRYAPYLSLECVNADYIANHVMLKAHARAYRVYEKEFKAQQQGKVSIILAAWFFKPKTDSEDDRQAAVRAQQFTTGWCAHPIYSTAGNYPSIVRRLIDEKSKEEGMVRSKLPRFTQEEIDEIKGSYDFMAINHYTSVLVSVNRTNAKAAWKFRDANVIVEIDENWPSTGTHWSKVVPWGFREVLCWIKQEYDNPPVYVTENGFCDRGDLNDIGRINFHKAYLKELLAAIHQHQCNVIGYHVWSLLDNFEWLAGSSARYGIVHVNHENPERERTLKKSASFFRRLCQTRSISLNDEE